VTCLTPPQSVQSEPTVGPAFRSVGETAPTGDLASPPQSAKSAPTGYPAPTTSVGEKRRLGTPHRGQQAGCPFRYTLSHAFHGHRTFPPGRRESGRRTFQNQRPDAACRRHLPRQLDGYDRLALFPDYGGAEPGSPRPVGPLLGRPGRVRDRTGAEVCRFLVAGAGLKRLCRCGRS